MITWQEDWTVGSRASKVATNIICERTGVLTIRKVIDTAIFTNVNGIPPW
ncbi:hypothetical protein Nizo2259_2026 [Lactiplantibacillus plantarum]|uniref:Uncharacterized protein n=1 Tax=Lactiplantibacillus plantarum TaxID=1590 RepID=A0AAW3RDM9_LACPN|nr:hypothetical protein Nizo2259_2026 [Lactiplantibacillus plantarum]GEK63159.1 hypothetical protein LJA01_10620 [Lactobacillus japonicus]GEO52171.1 hypothetical protein LPL03_02670 [Lactiplantibacillus argentoratensis]KZV02757.1 hypothetical protein NAB2_1911 [Lactiplantibacillus plantarum]QKX11703.1 hypothetical protein Heal19_503097 [Lactiplantibacillus plantarum]